MPPLRDLQGRSNEHGRQGKGTRRQRGDRAFRRDPSRDSYRLVYGHAAESAERQQQRAREFSELVTNNLREQTEAGRANAQRLSEQAARQQEAGQALARESVEAYTQFLNDAFSSYRSGTEQAAGSAQEGVRTLTDTTTGLLSTATGAVGATAGATVEGAEQAAEAAVFPIEGYDEMNVDEISKRLEGLSAIRSSSVSRFLLSSS